MTEVINEYGLASENKDKIKKFLEDIYKANVDNYSQWEGKIFEFFSKEVIVPYFIDATDDKERDVTKELVKVFISPFQKSSIHFDTNQIYKKIIKIKESLDAGTKLEEYLNFFFIHNVALRHANSKKVDGDDSKFKNYGTKIERKGFLVGESKNQVYLTIYFICPDRDIDYPIDRWANQIRENFRNKLISKVKGKNNEKKRKPIDSRLRHECFKRDNYKCVECGATNKEKTLHADHIFPISQGGSDELDNLQTLCNECNFSKSNKYWKKEENGEE